MNAPTLRWLVALLAALCFLGDFGAPNLADAQTTRIAAFATYRERIALPRGAVFEATLEREPRSDGPGETLARVRNANPGAVPIAFEIPIDMVRIDPRRTYVIRASLYVEGRLRFTGTEAYRAPAQDERSRITVLMRAPSGKEDDEDRVRDGDRREQEGTLGGLPATYLGVLPCADCEGIRHQINLLPGGAYMQRMTYFRDNRDESFYELGTWTLSRDGRTLAFDRFSEREVSTWLMDVERGTTTRFTSEMYAAGPVWFPDGDRLAFVSVRDTPPNPFLKTMAGVETRLARMPKAVVLGSVTPDGTAVLGDLLEPATGDDLWLFPATVNAKPELFLQTPFNESTPRISPDGKWVAFTSDESGTDEIYVTTFPKAGRRHRVSADVGTSARWSADGKEILYRSRLRVMSATFAATGDAPAIGTPRELFTLPEGTGGEWVVADNGQRFLFKLRVTARQSAPMTVILNWPAMARGK